MKTEEKLLRRDLAMFVKKMKKAGIDITAIKKPTDVGASIGRT
ncbi:hypothetical protein ACFPRA_01525 [Sporosarcina soli]|uniref:Uncharacterized protein n=1 Tax=Sporosarcina soli TaxID=334736 RepID=A0ABW0TFS1_9BACL